MLLLNCFIQILFLFGKDGDQFHCLYRCSECICDPAYSTFYIIVWCSCQSLECCTLQAALQYRALLNRTLLAVPQHLEQIEKYAHSGTVQDDAYRTPWVRGGCLPLQSAAVQCLEQSALNRVYLDLDPVLPCCTMGNFVNSKLLQFTRQHN